MINTIYALIDASFSLEEISEDTVSMFNVANSLIKNIKANKGTTKSTGSSKKGKSDKMEDEDEEIDEQEEEKNDEDEDEDGDNKKKKKKGKKNTKTKKKTTAKKKSSSSKNSPKKIESSLKEIDKFSLYNNGEYILSLRSIYNVARKIFVVQDMNSTNENSQSKIYNEFMKEKSISEFFLEHMHQNLEKTNFFWDINICDTQRRDYASDARKISHVIFQYYSNSDKNSSSSKKNFLILSNFYDSLLLQVRYRSDSSTLPQWLSSIHKIPVSTRDSQLEDKNKNIIYQNQKFFIFIYFLFIFLLFLFFIYFIFYLFFYFYFLFIYFFLKKVFS